MDHRVVIRSGIVLLALLGLIGSFPARAVTYPGTGQLSTTIGPVRFKTGWPSGGGDLTLEALAGFRAAFTPFNIGLATGTSIVMYAVGHGLNAIEQMYFQPGKNVAPPTPSGWTDANTPPVSGITTNAYIYNGTQYTITNLGTAFCHGKNASTGWPYTLSQYGTDSNGDWVACGCRHECQGPDFPNDFRDFYPDGRVYARTIATRVVVCSSGYSNVNGTCTFDPSGANGWPSWPSGSAQPFVRQDGSFWSYHPSSSKYAGIDDIGTPASRTGKDSYGNPVRETLTPTSDGGVDYKREAQSEINGQPAVQTDKVHTDANGVVTSVTSNVAYNTSLTNVTQGGDTVVKIDTSDLNKEATQLQIKGGLDQINAKLDCANKTTLGCIELGEAGNKTELQTKDKADLFHEVSVGGGAGACPNDLAVSFLGFPYLVSYDLVCRYATGIHFVVVALAWVSAGWVMFGSWKGL